MKTRDTGQTQIKLFDVGNFLNYASAWFKQFISKVLTVYTVRHVLIFFFFFFLLGLKFFIDFL